MIRCVLAKSFLTLLAMGAATLFLVPAAMAQQGGSNTQTRQPTSFGGTAMAPVYNTAPMPMVQGQPGRNAPSYSFNNNRDGMANPPAGFDPRSFPTMNNSLSPEESARITAQRNAQAQMYEQDYLARLQAASELQRNNLLMGQMMNMQGGAMPGGFVNPFAPKEEEKPKKRRVVYGERNDPLQTPPRLFNPDQ